MYNSDHLSSAFYPRAGCILYPHSPCEKGRLPPCGRGLECYLEILPTTHSPLLGTQLVVNQPRTRETVYSLPASSTQCPQIQMEKYPSKEAMHFLKRKRTSLPLLPLPLHTYTSERLESSTASEQSSLREARKGTLGEGTEGHEM